MQGGPLVKLACLKPMHNLHERKYFDEMAFGLLVAPQFTSCFILRQYNAASTVTDARK
jgi:hypothetical protein